MEAGGNSTTQRADISHITWQSHCHRLVQLPIAAGLTIRDAQPRHRADLILKHPYVHALDVGLINEIRLQTASQFCIVVTE
jgi:hypothetical protein